MRPDDALGIRQFLKEYPGMSILPSRSGGIVLKGFFSFEAKEIIDSYSLQISIPKTFPKEIPKVIEQEEKIPRDGKHHVNPDTTLCLGSPLRLRMKLSEEPNLIGFTNRCLVPYLYAISYKLRNGGDLIFNELAHGEKGILDDYMDILGLKERKHVIQALKLLGMRPRNANKELCPCGCGRRLSKCQFRWELNKYRKLANRSWFRAHAKNPGAGI